MTHKILIASSVAPTIAAASAAPISPLDCSLHDLAACQNVNDLAWSRADNPRQRKPRYELAGALTLFLHGAPNLYLGKTVLNPIHSATGALGGPGDHHDHLPNGSWFFDGFTPHDATDRGGAIFGADGTILMVALLTSETDTPDADPTMGYLYRYRLHLYSHGKPDDANIALLRNWARNSLKTENATYPGEPKENFAGTTLLVLDKSRWKRNTLP